MTAPDRPRRPRTAEVPTFDPATEARLDRASEVTPEDIERAQDRGRMRGLGAYLEAEEAEEE